MVVIGFVLEVGLGDVDVEVVVVEIEGCGGWCVGFWFWDFEGLWFGFEVRVVSGEDEVIF